MDIEGGVIFGAGGRPVNPIVWLLDKEDELVIGWRNRGVEAVKESTGLFSCNVVVVLVYLEDVDRGGVVGWAAHTCGLGDWLVLGRLDGSSRLCSFSRMRPDNNMRSGSGES